MVIREIKSEEREQWDKYVGQNPRTSHCHLYGWKQIVENSYKQKGHYLVALDRGEITGILPLIHIRSSIFSPSLVSMPYLTCGGTIADTEEIEIRIKDFAIQKGIELDVHTVELRAEVSEDIKQKHCDDQKSSTKVNMLLRLPVSSELLLSSFPSKLRSQIRRPVKEGMSTTIGGMELLDDFYDVFKINMRDLGSPVHAKKLFRNILDTFQTKAKIGIVYYKKKPVAAGLILRFRDRVEIPWASSLRMYNKFSPNMLLYWSLLEFSCNTGAQIFDFGRSTPGEGTYRFKKQWGAKPQPLNWQFVDLREMSSRKDVKNHNYWQPININSGPTKKFNCAMSLWKNIPVWLTVLIGSRIRGGISL